MINDLRKCLTSILHNKITKYCFLKKQADKVKKHIINKIPHCSA